MPQDHLHPERLRGALAYIDPDLSNPEWHRVLNAIVSSCTSREIAHQVAEAWSAGELAKTSKAIRKGEAKLFRWELEGRVTP